MVNTTRHDPITLFAFALRERDWALADLLARRLGTGGRVQRELEAQAWRPGHPRTVEQLRLFAQLARNLGLGDDRG